MGLTLGEYIQLDTLSRQIDTRAAHFMYTPPEVCDWCSGPHHSTKCQVGNSYAQSNFEETYYEENYNWLDLEKLGMTKSQFIDIALECDMELSEEKREEPLVLTIENQAMEEPIVLTKEKLLDVLEEKPIEVFQAQNYIDPFEAYIIGISNSDKHEISRYLQKLDGSSLIFIERLLEEPWKLRTKPLPTNQRYVFLGASYENAKVFKDQFLITLVDPT